ncbi:MAG: hypothetical protein EZS28_023270 [Streblomastix strix]|uniref:Uncharacterized protein n=1 Tax=Streblomastix strix TaxID=222440 RepID=A0A5J4VF52_9EUKA|nr:MAG: hypothetical protein EZS28_023270 [Streblomastix strix]
MLHALVFLEARSTLRGTEIASIRRDSVKFEYECIKLIVSKKKAKNGGRETVFRPSFGKTINPFIALWNLINILNYKFPNGQVMWLKKISRFQIKGFEICCEVKQDKQVLEKNMVQIPYDIQL